MVGKLLQRRQEQNYKLVTFMYISTMGFLILICHPLSIPLTGEVVLLCSPIVLLLHCAYFAYVLKANPYQLSLNIHKRGLIINLLVLLIFIVYINVINYVGTLP